MIRPRVGTLIAVIGLVWLGCGGSEFSPQDDGGSQGSTTGASGTTTGSTSSDATGTRMSGSGGATGGSGGNGTGPGGSGVGGTGGGKAGAGGGTGGQPVDASLPDAPLPCAGSVTFHMSAANGRSSDFCIGAQCSNVWVTVTTGTGSAVTFFQGCVASCSNCMPVACPPVLCALPQPMKAQGESFTWDGTEWDPGMCGAQMTCRSHQCAARGSYVAKMCASHSVPDAGPLGQCSPTPTLTCVDVPFDYPSATVVEGMIN